MNQKVVVYNEDYITNLLATKAEENTYLEFKRADSLIIHPNNKSKNLEEIKNEIAKDVSAFANSDGGVLIYGIAEDNHVATDYSFIDGNTFTKETLEQIINSRIHRKIDGLRIEPIRFKNDITKTIYIVEIPRSTNAPHQTKDKKFYKRRNFYVDEMEEFEIRELYNRKNLAKLEILEPVVHSKIHQIPKDISESYNLRIKFHVDFYIQNIGNSVEQLFKTEIGFVFSTLDPLIIQKITTYDRTVVNGYEKYIIPNSSPIFQNERFKIITVYFQINFNKTLLNFINKPIMIKLYYTDGVVEKDFYIADKILEQKDNIIEIKEC
jgi:hypothetical protein